MDIPQRRIDGAIIGACFDLLGYLTTREDFKCGRSSSASIPLEHLRHWLLLRCMGDVKMIDVSHWQKVTETFQQHSKCFMVELQDTISFTVNDRLYVSTILPSGLTIYGAAYIPINSPLPKSIICSGDLFIFSSHYFQKQVDWTIGGDIIFLNASPPVLPTNIKIGGIIRGFTGDKSNYKYEFI